MFSCAIGACITLLSSCALIDISEVRQVTHINYTQETPVGVVHLFMLELDSNNSKGAVVLLADQYGYVLTPEKRIEMYPEMQRLRRILKFNPITNVTSDTLDENRVTVNMEVDYFKNYQFNTLKINDSWYITEYTFK